MSDQESNADGVGANPAAGHRIIFGSTREGCTRVHQELTQGKGNYQWMDDCGGSAGKTKLAVTLIESFVKLGRVS